MSDLSDFAQRARSRAMSTTSSGTVSTPQNQSQVRNQNQNRNRNDDDNDDFEEDLGTRTARLNNQTRPAVRHPQVQTFTPNWRERMTVPPGQYPKSATPSLSPRLEKVSPEESDFTKEMAEFTKIGKSPSSSTNSRKLQSPNSSPSPKVESLNESVRASLPNLRRFSPDEPSPPPPRSKSPGPSRSSGLGGVITPPSSRSPVRSLNKIGNTSLNEAIRQASNTSRTTSSMNSRTQVPNIEVERTPIQSSTSDNNDVTMESLALSSSPRSSRISSPTRSSRISSSPRSSRISSSPRSSRISSPTRSSRISSPTRSFQSQTTSASSSSSSSLRAKSPSPKLSSAPEQSKETPTVSRLNSISSTLPTSGTPNLTAARLLPSVSRNTLQEENFRNRPSRMSRESVDDDNDTYYGDNDDDVDDKTTSITQVNTKLNREIGSQTRTPHSILKQPVFGNIPMNSGSRLSQNLTGAQSMQNTQVGQQNLVPVLAPQVSSSLNQLPNSSIMTPPIQPLTQLPTNNLSQLPSSNLTQQQYSARNLPTASSLPPITNFSSLSSNSTLSSLPAITNLPSQPAQPPNVNLNTSLMPVAPIYNLGSQFNLLPPVSISSYSPHEMMLSDGQIGKLNWGVSVLPQPSFTDRGLISSEYVRLGVIGDGNCFFHSMSRGLSKPYRESYNIPATITEATLRTFENEVISPTSPVRIFTFNSVRPINSSITSRGPNTPLTTEYTVIPAGFVREMAKYRTEYAKQVRIEFANRLIKDKIYQNIIKNHSEGPIDVKLDEIVAQLGIDISGKLSRDYTMKDYLRDVGIEYDDLYDNALSAVLNDYVIDLRTMNSVMPNYALFFSDLLDTDIYILRDVDLRKVGGTQTPLYSGTSLHQSVRGPQDMRTAYDINIQLPNRRAIVIISFADNHYEIIARKDRYADREVISAEFTQQEPIIRELFGMLQTLRARGQ